jgi:hypothetical protein
MLYVRRTVLVRSTKESKPDGIVLHVMLDLEVLTFVVGLLSDMISHAHEVAHY